MNPRYAVYRILVHSRPRFWLYTAGPFLVGYGAGATALGQFAESLFIYGMIYFMFFANLYLYGVNDLFDLDTDLLNPKKAGPERSAAGATRLLAASATASALAAVPLADDPTAASLTALYLILSTAYSTPPLRLKARHLLDSYSNWLYIVPARLGTTCPRATSRPPGSGRPAWRGRRVCTPCRQCPT
jgi:4-hydroxybenzoate polyprenyltransferase